MSEQNTDPRVESPGSQRLLPLLLLLFFGSGCAALIYEIVWFQLLQLVIGSSAVSLGVLLGTFMGGMCLGSVALPSFISKRQHPLRVYAFLICDRLSCGRRKLSSERYVGNKLRICRIFRSAVGGGHVGSRQRKWFGGIYSGPEPLAGAKNSHALYRWTHPHNHSSGFRAGFTNGHCFRQGHHKGWQRPQSSKRYDHRRGRQYKVNSDRFVGPL